MLIHTWCGFFMVSIMVSSIIRIYKPALARYLRDLYSPPPTPPLKTTPLPSQPQKFCYVQVVNKITKVLEDGRENG